MNRLADETSPYLLQHADNPVEWYPWGDEALQRARARRPADPALDRLLGLPLVPRHGARVVRGPRDGRADEPALREHQGRPRGAARPRRGLHERGGRDDRPRRLADDRLPDSRRRAVPRRHLLPARAASRPCPSFRQVLEAVDRAWRERRDEVEQRGRATGRGAARGGRGRRRRASRSRADLLTGALAGAALGLRPRAGAASAAPPSSRPPRGRPPAAAAPAHGQRRRAADGDRHARRHGRSAGCTT